MATSVNERWLEHAVRRLNEAGLRAGAGRVAVVELMAREGRCLVTPQALVARLREDGTGSNATVYRALETLHGLGLVHRVDGRDGVARYEIADPDDHHHHHVDEDTGEVLPFRDDALEAAVAAAAERLGLELTGHEVILRGTRALVAGG